MSNQHGTLWVSFNGEIYNYLELRSEHSDSPYRTQTGTEVILAAYERWGEKCLDHFLGMFAFLLWDGRTQPLFAARGRFGVKPLYYHVRADGTLSVASEIKALHVAEVPAAADVVTWATYLTYGLYDHPERTFWRDIQSFQSGRTLWWLAHFGL
jgi:asparagine synthase (glutamine-hydrolysing)